MCAVMRLADVVDALEQLAPTRLAESWDNVGLLVGDPEDRIARVLFAIDYTAEVAREAEEVGAKLVVAYHPPIFEPLKRLVSSSLIVQAIKRGVALYSPHTALDVVEGGTNDMLADVVEMAERAPLRVRTYPGEADAKTTRAGMGRIGSLASPTPRSALVTRIKTGLGLEHVLVAGPEEGTASRVAVSAGSAGDMYRDAIAGGADVYVTGEMRHHDALACAAAGMTVVAVLHSNSERKALRSYAERFAVRAAGLLITISRSDRDPFTIV